MPYITHDIAIVNRIAGVSSIASMQQSSKNEMEGRAKGKERGIRQVWESDRGYVRACVHALDAVRVNQWRAEAKKRNIITDVTSDYENGQTCQQLRQNT
jgi:hypothetical protein